MSFIKIISLEYKDKQEIKVHPLFRVISVNKNENNYLYISGIHDGYKESSDGLKIETRIVYITKEGDVDNGVICFRNHIGSVVHLGEIYHIFISNKG
ncbi:MAG: hypothetical protein AABY32_01030 [Nanoarchaeota archaeon]